MLEHQDFRETINVIFRSFRNLIGATSGYVALLTQDSTAIKFVLVETGESKLDIPGTLRLSDPGVHRTVYEQKVVVYQNDSPVNELAGMPSSDLLDLQNILIAPLVLQDEVAGFLCLGNKPEGFSSSDVRMASAFGELAAIALRNSRTLESLESSEERFRSVVETAGEAIISVDSRANIVFWNHAAETIFGYPASEMLGKSLSYIIPERFSKKISVGLQHAASSGHLDFVDKTFDLVGLTRDLNEFPAELSFTEWKTREGLFFTAIVRDVTERRRAQKSLEQSFEKLQKTLEGTIQAMALTAEMRDPYTAGHQQRVAQLSAAIAKEMGLSPDQINKVRLAALVHDIGKINVPAEILSKPGRLTDIEFSMIKVHPEVGYSILNRIEFPWPIASIVHQHHERINGTGYPSGLTDEEILFEAKILAVADVVEAMASHRPYRPALGIDRALEEISQAKGVKYDTGVADACFKVFTEKGFKFS